MREEQFQILKQRILDSQKSLEQAYALNFQKFVIGRYKSYVEGVFTDAQGNEARITLRLLKS